MTPACTRVNRTIAVHRVYKQYFKQRGAAWRLEKSSHKSKLFEWAFSVNFSYMQIMPDDIFL